MFCYKVKENIVFLCISFQFRSFIIQHVELPFGSKNVHFSPGNFLWFYRVSLVLLDNVFDVVTWL